MSNFSDNFKIKKKKKTFYSQKIFFYHKILKKKIWKKIAFIIKANENLYIENRYSDENFSNNFQSNKNRRQM